MERLETVLESVELDMKPQGIEYMMDCGHNLQPYDCLVCQNQFDTMNKPDFYPTSTGIVIKHKIPEIDLHDTYKTDRYDNMYGGHTTASILGKRKTLDFLDDF